MNIQLLFNTLKLSVQKRLGTSNNQNSSEKWRSKNYIFEPEVSFVIQSHNKSLQVCHIVSKLRQWQSAEIIVIDDGSENVHTKRLTSFLTKANEFLIRANDLFEIITYDRAIRFANAKYVVLLQDDDDFDNLEWVEKGLTLMEKYPDMVFLGGKDGRSPIFTATEYAGSSDAIIKDSAFCFVAMIDRAPEWINKHLFMEHLLHIDQSFAPFQYDDFEICLRAWLSGYKIGWYNAGFHSLSVGGMRLYNSAFTKEQCKKNGQKLFDLYSSQEKEVLALVSQANKTM